MRTFAGLLTVLMCLCATNASARPLHKVHVSVSQIEYKPSAGAVEVVMRVYVDDLEQALSRHAKREVRLNPARGREAGPVVLAYLQSQFELKSRTGKPVRFLWKGVESQVDMYWLYFEGKLPGGFEGAQLKNRVLCELYDDQVNIVNIRYQGKQTGAMFEARDEFKPIGERKGAK